MDELIREINKYPNGTILLIRWENGLKIKGEVDTIHETDNGLEEDDEKYMEFHACILKVISIFNNPLNDEALEEGSLMEISMQNPPIEIVQEDETVIWKAI